jgi:phosphohistidine phosphatase
MIERTLVVLRHAKSSWKSDATHDHERPLNSRGRRDAPAVGAHLAGLGWQPELVLCSDARRTMQTWNGMEAVFDGSAAVSYNPRLYHAGMGEVRQALSFVGAQIQRVMVVGHNPGWEQVVEWLSATSVRLTTCNAVILRGQGSTWEEALSERGNWSIEAIIRPKEI